MNLRNKILCLLSIATITPLFALSWVLIENHKNIETHLLQRQMVYLETIAKDLEDKISSTSQLLFGLGRVPILEGNKKECSDFLAEVLQENPQYTGILTIKPDGSLYCDSLRTDRVLNLTDRSYFQRAITTKRLVVEPAIGRLTGKSVLQIAYPVITPKEKLKYILLASLNLDEYGTNQGSKLSFDRMHFQIWNDKGSFILDYPKNTSKMIPTPEIKEKVLTTSDNITNLFKITTDPNSLFVIKTILPKWTNLELILTLIIPEDVVDNYTNGQFKQTAIGVIIFIIIILGISLFLGEYIIRRQLLRLSNSISKLSIGDYSSIIGEPYPTGELGELMKILDNMSISIKQQTEKLYQQANFDELTNLANRNKLNTDLLKIIENSKENKTNVGVLLLDLDRFKTINDSLGHACGDVLLKMIAERLQNITQLIDIVARFSGDEFVIIVSNILNPIELLEIANKILKTLSEEPFLINSHEINITCSIGIAVYPTDSELSNELLQFADTAMYRAKNKGGNIAFLFTKNMTDRIQKYLNIELGLQEALNKKKFILKYQPIIDSNTGKIISAEALLRCENDKGILMNPAEFIPIAEDTGLIIPIGCRIFNEACRQVKLWQKLNLGNVSIAVNLSAKQFKYIELEKTILNALRDNDCPATLLQIEITESSIINDLEQSLRTINNLKSIGIKISIDDFGTGYSSLSQLKQLPIDHLKIDQSFVKDINDENGNIFIETIINLAKKLNLQIIAEGVETQEQVDFLKLKGCDKYQGYLSSRPVIAEEFEALLYKINGEKLDEIS